MTQKMTTAQPLRPPSAPPASGVSEPPPFRLVVDRKSLEYVVDELKFTATHEGGMQQVSVTITFEAEGEQRVRCSTTGEVDTIKAVVAMTRRRDLLNAVLNAPVFVL